MEKKKEKKVDVKVRLTPGQIDMIHKRMKELHTNNREAYIRKMAIDGYILDLDDTAIREMCRLLRSISNNFNQVAKMANSSGNVYETDLMDMSQKLNRIWDAQTQLIAKLSQLK